MKLRFLGTGGGRYVTGMQRRKTAGILVETGETAVIVDPGPGALVELNREGLAEEVQAAVVSHAHLDHAGDAEAIVEMMTEAYDQPGAVFANETALQGHGELERQVSGYHQELCAKVEMMEDGSELEFQDLEIRSQEMFHSDPRTQGFILETGEKSVGFWTDTEFSEELAEFYQGVDTLVVYCSRPRNEPYSSHTALDDVPRIVEEAGSGTVIVTHFGFKFLDSDLEEQESWLQDSVDCQAVFADDGMEYPGNRRLGDF